MILIWHKSPIIMNWSLQLMHNSNLITEHSWRTAQLGHKGFMSLKNYLFCPSPLWPVQEVRIRESVGWLVGYPSHTWKPTETRRVKEQVYNIQLVLSSISAISAISAIPLFLLAPSVINMSNCDSLYEKGPLHALNQFAERQFESRKKKKFFFLNFFFLTCTRSRAFQLAPRQISPEVSLVWLS